MIEDGENEEDCDNKGHPRKRTLSLHRKEKDGRNNQKKNSQAFEGTIQDVEETRLASREKLDCGKKKDIRRKVDYRRLAKELTKWRRKKEKETEDLEEKKKLFDIKTALWDGFEKGIKLGRKEFKE